MFFDTDGSHFFSPIRGGVNLLRNWGVNLTGIINWYIGQQKFNTIDGTFNEELYITYHFIKNKYHNFGWECVLSTAIKSDNDYYHIENISITKEKADSILVSWGLGNNKF